jgi:sugar lactone lactonase YvrE
MRNAQFTPPTGVVLALTAWLLPAATSAQAFTTTVIARDLLRPTGIVASPNGTLWITELPEPGRMGGNNMVSRLEVGGGKTVLVAGEPEPTHLARTASGVLYWTCGSAGVIQRFVNNTRTTVISQLMTPSGMAVGDDGTLYFTQVPTPGRSGMNGGRNTVNSWTMAAGTQTITMGEPEPRDIAIDAHGNLFWTCKSANVILWRNARTGMVSPLLRGLDRPSGIAVDAQGALYFSEVPTPGVNGRAGGRNRVTRYVPATQTLTLINFGDPEPFDVAVSPDGMHVYWTCTSAGVVVRATRNRAPVTLSTMTALGMGVPTPLLLRASEFAGHMYVAASSFGLGPLVLGVENLALAADPLFLTTVGGSWPNAFAGYVGRLDGAGAASAAIVLPNRSELAGLALNTAYVVLDARAPLGVVASDTLRLVID